MSAGLLVSGSTAYLVFKTPWLSRLILGSFLIIFLRMTLLLMKADLSSPKIKDLLIF